MLSQVRFGHVLRIGGKAIGVTSYMSGHTAIVEEQLNLFARGMQFNGFANQLMRHRIQPLVELNVIIDVHFNAFNVRVLIGIGWQWQQCRPVNLFESLKTMALKAFKRFGIDLCQQGLNTLVEFTQREKGLVTQTG